MYRPEWGGGGGVGGGSRIQLNYDMVAADTYL